MTMNGSWMVVAAAMVVALSGPVRTQEARTITLAMSGRANSAPWIASSGRTVAVTWAAAVGSASDIYVAISHDEGATFGRPVQVNRVAGDGRVGGEIPPRVALHRRPDATEPDVVVAWNAKDAGTEIKVARSSDGGRSFGPATSLQSPGAPGDRGWHSLALDDQGVAHVLWLDHRGLAEAPANGSGAKAGAHQHKGEHDGVAMAQKSGLRYATFGARASADRELTPGVCYCCKSAVVALPGGTVLSAWRHVYADNMRDIAFTVSRDGGRTFAAPARVSEDGWSINGCPDDGPALAADPQGRLHIVWPTVIPGDEPVGAIFYAPGRDGAGFAARVRVPTLGSLKPSHPQVVANASGRIVVAWDEVIDGVRTAAYVTGSLDRDGSVRFGTPARLAASGPTAYPVMAASGQGVLAVWTAGSPAASVIHVRRIVPGAGQSSSARQERQ